MSMEKLLEVVERQEILLEKQGARLAEFEEKNGQLLQENQRLLGELRILANKLFRRKSERLDPRQLMLFLQQQADEETDHEQREEPEPASAPKRKKKGHGRATFARTSRVH